ncbi:MAG: aldehyde ferredoxin oxidoreductase C-terminal domain-containing protein [Dehalobacterium sp.]
MFYGLQKKTIVRKGENKALTIEGPEYETLYTFEGLCCINRLDKIFYLNGICDRLGIDTISAGNMAALEDIAYGRGAGKVLAKGIKVAAKEWGLEEYGHSLQGIGTCRVRSQGIKRDGLAYATST